MKQKHNYTTLNRYTISSLVFLVTTIAAVSIAVTKYYHTEAAPSPKAAVSAEQSQFSFNATAATDWHKGPSNATSLALFHGGDCFISVQFKPGTVDEAAELQKSQTSLAGSGYTSTPDAILPMTLQTATGQQQYQLHQYTVSGAGNGGQLYGGQAFGYAPLPSGYAFIEGYCNTPAELPAIISGLQTLKFTKL